MLQPRRIAGHRPPDCLAILACLVFALGNPILSLGNIKPRAIAVILDNSASMQSLETDGRPRFALAREAVAVGTPGLAAVVARFGRDILDASGALDRRKLAALVFSDPEARRDLEAIIHPIVRARTDAWFETLDPRKAFAVADIPLLYETGRERDFDECYRSERQKKW